MKRTLQFGVKVLVAVTALTRLVPACGDPLAQAVAGTKARLVIQGHDSIVRIGEPVFANLILPKDSPLPTGRLSRASCTSLQFTVEPAVGWHDPWAGWHYSGIEGFERKWDVTPTIQGVPGSTNSVWRSPARF